MVDWTVQCNTSKVPTEGFRWARYNTPCLPESKQAVGVEQSTFTNSPRLLKTLFSLWPPRAMRATQNLPLVSGWMSSNWNAVVPGTKANLRTLSVVSTHFGRCFNEQPCAFQFQRIAFKIVRERFWAFPPCVKTSSEKKQPHSWSHYPVHANLCMSPAMATLNYMLTLAAKTHPEKAATSRAGQLWHPFK